MDRLQVGDSFSEDAMLDIAKELKRRLDEKGRQRGPDPLRVVANETKVEQEGPLQS